MSELQMEAEVDEGIKWKAERNLQNIRDAVSRTGPFDIAIEGNLSHCGHCADGACKSCRSGRCCERN